MAKEAFSWSKPDGMPGLIGRKQVDWSIFVDGTTIPQELYEDFAWSNGGALLQPGEKHDAVLVIDRTEYPAILTYLDRSDASPVLQLRYSVGTPQVALFRSRFRHSFKLLQALRESAATSSGKKVYAKLDKDQAEFIDFYATETPFRYRLELVTRSTSWAPLTFAEVWTELQTVIGSGASIRTLGEGAINLVTPGGSEGIMVQTSAEPELVQRGRLEAAWNALCDRKLAAARDLGAGQFRSAVIMAVLALLPHVEYATEPRVTLFLRDHLFTEDELVHAFELIGEGPVRWPRRHASPRIAFILADAGNSRWDDSRLCLAVNQQSQQVLENGRQSSMPLYGFFRDLEGRFRYIGRLSVQEVQHSAHGEVVLTQAPTPTPQFRSWIFQANSKTYDLDGALSRLRTLTWLVRQHAKEIRAGDEVFLWNAGENAGVVAMATVMSDPALLPENEAEKPYYLSEERFEDERLRVPLRVDRVLPARITRTQFRVHPVLCTLPFLAGPQGTNFPVPPQLAYELRRLPEPGADEEGLTLDLKAVVDQFSEALAHSHIHFGSRHDEVIRSFVASLATKPFAILTGLSGSGKTQVALRFGEWLGEDRSLIVAVRPDWTGAEALFGYEDALQKGADGRPSWYVPDVLAFMLKAAVDQQYPYLLILDEMNLAHVERYFADVLSGMESGKPCLPNLRKDTWGKWQVPTDGPERIPFPHNLFVVGTVNVDETTYMFSPKVLDRANTFEFRVETDALSGDTRKPVSCQPGPSSLVRGFLAIACDHSWQVSHPATGASGFSDSLRTVHRLLSEGGFEFGHRVFYEALRYEAMLEAAGDANPMHALDLQIMQKILPRLHGNRKRLEPTLCALGQFCATLGYEAGAVADGAPIRFNPLLPLEGGAKLPRSFEKLRRMTRSLRANKFTSFTE